MRAILARRVWHQALLVAYIPAIVISIAAQTVVPIVVTLLAHITMRFLWIWATNGEELPLFGDD